MSAPDLQPLAVSLARRLGAATPETRVPMIRSALESAFHLGTDKAHLLAQDTDVQSNDELTHVYDV